MSEILSRERIAQQAEEAARRYLETGSRPANPFPSFTDAALAWGTYFIRYSQLLAAPEEGASA